MTDDATPPSSPATWLVRVPRVFSGLTARWFKEMGLAPGKKLGQDYHLIRLPSAELLGSSEAQLMLSWKLPVHHGWPCDPQATRGFVEKAAQALAEKFGTLQVQAIQIGPLDADPSQRYFRALASNLRGRVLQLFPGLSAPKHEAEEQDPAAPTLFCLVGREGLCAGVQSPRACGGFHPGGTMFIKQNAPGAISRAGAKVAEALHHLRLHRPALAQESHWLELGASPGGMTSELLVRGHRVTAVDRAPLDARLRRARGLTFVQEDVAAFRPDGRQVFDVILCDLNGDPLESLRHVVRLARLLRPRGLVIFTLKLPGARTLPEMVTLSRAASSMTSEAGLSQVALTHLSYNRHEFTIFFERGA